MKFRLSIVLATQKKCDFNYFATSYLRWYSAERDNLFPRFQYLNCTSLVQSSTFPKLGDAAAASVLRKVKDKSKLRDATSAIGASLYYHNCPVNWIRATTFVPGFWSERDGDKTSTQIRELNFDNAAKRDAACCVINSTLFFLNWLSYSDCYHLTARELFDFAVGIDELVDTHGTQLTELCKELMKDFKKHSRQRTYVYKTTGKVIYDEFYPKLSKSIINKIDIVLGQHFQMSQLEVDFLINFDFKYRMGIDRAGND